jgi:hypothetical protein
MSTHDCRVTILVTTLLAVLVTACAPVSGNSPEVIEKLKRVSADYTGCPADDNQISNVVTQPGNSGTWTATCKGNVFNCVANGVPGGHDSFTCRPAPR